MKGIWGAGALGTHFKIEKVGKSSKFHVLHTIHTYNTYGKIARRLEISNLRLQISAGCERFDSSK